MVWAQKQASEDSSSLSVPALASTTLGNYCIPCIYPDIHHEKISLYRTVKVPIYGLIFILFTQRVCVHLIGRYHRCTGATLEIIWS